MKPTSLLLLLLLATVPAAASDGTTARNDKTSAFQFSFCPRLGTNGPLEREYTNYVSVNLTVGISGGERGLAVAGLSNVVRGDATGVQVAGFSNHVRGAATGLAVAGVVNTVRDSLRGVQLAAAANHAGDVRGVQLAGLYNVARGGLRGMQLAAAANHAGDVRGVQLAGLYNVAGQVRGMQIGIVNVAESSDWTLGLVNIVKDGVMTLGLQYDAAGSALLAFRSGGRHLYGILGAGYNHRIGGAVAEAGIGVRIPCTRWLDLRQEVTASSLYDAEGKAAWGADYLFAPAFRIGQHLALTVGAGVGYQSFYPTHQPVASPFPLWQGDDGRQVSLNLQAGIEYVF